MNAVVTSKRNSKHNFKSKVKPETEYQRKYYQPVLDPLRRIIQGPKTHDTKLPAPATPASLATLASDESPTTIVRVCLCCNKVTFETQSRFIRLCSRCTGKSNYETPGFDWSGSLK